jgi:hypothetical protein
VRALPELTTFSLGMPDCGIAVNNGQQILFSSSANISPGDIPRRALSMLP